MSNDVTVPKMIYSLNSIEEISTKKLLFTEEVELNLKERTNDPKFRDELDRSISATTKSTAILVFMSVMIVVSFFDVLPKSMLSALNRSDYFTVSALIFGILFALFGLFPLTFAQFRLMNRFKQLKKDTLSISRDMLINYGKIYNGKIRNIITDNNSRQINYEFSFMYRNQSQFVEQVYTTTSTQVLEVGDEIRVFGYNEYINILL